MLLAYLVVFVLLTLEGQAGGPQQMSNTAFTEQIERGNVAEVFARGDSIQGELKELQPVPGQEGRTYRLFGTERPTFAQDDLLSALEDNGAVVRATPVEPNRGILANLLISFGLILLLGGFWLWLFRAPARPGRFDRTVTVSAPDQKGRVEILRVHTRSVPLAADLDLEQIARSTPGMTGA